MADTAVPINAGSGTNIDTRTEATNSNHRQVVVIGDPSLNAGVAAVKDVSVTPATATDPALVTVLRPDSPGIIATGTAGAASATVLTVQGVASMTKLLVTPDSVALPANQSVNNAQVNAVTILTGTGAVGTGAQRIAVGTDTATIAGSAPGTQASPSASYLSTVAAGDIAAAATDSGNPVKIGAKASSAEPTAVTTGQRANFYTDLVGKHIVLPYANPENSLNGQITSAMTGTTSTAVSGMGAQGAGIRVYVTTVIIGNTHATVGTMVNLQDGSGGAVLAQIPAAPVYGGGVTQFPVPIKTTANTGLFAVNATTGASTLVTCIGYKGI